LLIRHKELGWYLPASLVYNEVYGPENTKTTQEKALVEYNQRIVQWVTIINSHISAKVVDLGQMFNVSVAYEMEHDKANELALDLLERYGKKGWVSVHFNQISYDWWERWLIGKKGKITFTFTR
jgi:hypothetical protein